MTSVYAVCVCAVCCADAAAAMCIYAMFANWRHRYYQHQHEWLRTIIRWRGLFQNTRTKTTTQTLHTFYSSPTTTTTVTAALIRHLSIVVTIKAENICANILKIIYMMVISTSICIAMCVAVVFFFICLSVSIVLCSQRVTFCNAQTKCPGGDGSSGSGGGKLL